MIHKRIVDRIATNYLSVKSKKGKAAAAEWANRLMSGVSADDLEAIRQAVAQRVKGAQ